MNGDLNGDDEKTKPVVVRFAPSPNGYLHLGHAYSALLNHRFARRMGGQFLLRIEDIDIGRSRPEFEAAILEDLAWLGIDWDGAPRRQSDHLSDYAVALEQLSDRGLAYACTCSRAEIAALVEQRHDWPRDPEGAPLYPGTCREHTPLERQFLIASGKPAAQRLDMMQAVSEMEGPVGWREYGEGDAPRDVSAQPTVWGDVVLGRKDVPGSYHVAVVVDDALQGVTDVIRGMDLFETTSLHRLLQELLDLPAPRYHHHRLILDDHGRKLSKSAGSTTLRSLRESGVSAQDVRRKLGFE